MCSRLLIFWWTLGGVGVLRTGPVEYWPPGGDAAKAHGNGNDVWGSFTPTAERFGTAGGAMSFGVDVDDKIDLEDTPEFQVSGAMTPFLHVFKGDNSNDGRIMAKAAPPVRAAGAYISNSTCVRWFSDRAMAAGDLK
ncbi:MAG: hypothetical protein IH624_08725 [Phycisphaerae bacterium]|nr:hypothetical protein [Phycisphaerae bacterium]